MQGMHTDYRLLYDPFEEEDDEETFLSMSEERLYVIIARDELTTLCEAKKSLNWPEWQKSMETLIRMGHFGISAETPKSGTNLQ